MKNNNKSSIINLRFYKIGIICGLLFFANTCTEFPHTNPFDSECDVDWSPINLQAEALNDSEVLLEWEQVEENITGFKLERKTDSGSFTEITKIVVTRGNIKPDQKQYTDTNLEYGQSYSYRVFGYTSNGHTSDYSDTTTILFYNDCNNDFMGSAIIDDCGVCSEGNTGHEVNSDKDCNGDCFGEAVINACDYCAGGNTGLAEDYCTMTDQDGNIYETVQIGNQTWMAENLKVTHYRNGDAIPTGYSNSEWTNLSTGAYTVYDNNESNADTYGYLYNWYAMNDSRNIAPDGWHIPTDEEWMELEMALGMSESEANSTGWRGTDQGSQLAGRADLWNNGDLENNSNFGTSGFNALPGGYRYANNGYYGYMGTSGYFWSSTVFGDYDARSRGLSYSVSEVYRNYYYKSYGFALRLLRD